MSVVVETIELQGHIIDSLSLPKVLDAILAAGVEFDIEEVRVGRHAVETSFARIRLQADSDLTMDALVADLQSQGARLVHEHDAEVTLAEQDGAFPDGFYATTNLETAVRRRGRWVPVEDIEMDCGIVVDDHAGTARCTPMHQVKKGNWVVRGHSGIRVAPVERPRSGESFEFMSSAISAEKPKWPIVQEVARELTSARMAGKPCLLVAGPAVVHTGGAEAVADLIHQGYIQALFAGNGLATHDIEVAMYGTSLGVPVGAPCTVSKAHQNHLRAINTIRRLGSIEAAIHQGTVTKGIMHACITKGVPFILAGSIRDDGPLPEVITDVVAAMDAVRSLARDAGVVLVMASMLHAIAIGNILPAATRLIVVDINPAALTKVLDRGSFQTVAIVSDAGLFLRQLVDALAQSTATNGTSA